MSAPTPRAGHEFLGAAALACWHSGLRAVDAFDATVHALPQLREPTLIIATGKAGVAMARAACQRFPQVPALVLVPHGSDTSLIGQSARCLFGSHPYPDAAGMEASRELLDAAQALQANDHLLYLISGGSSALFEAPAAGVEAGQLIDLHRSLVASGLDIGTMNALRSLVSATKAGGLRAAAAPAAVTTLVLSDVPGDDASVVGSGPTLGRAPSPSQRAALIARADVRDVLGAELCALLEQMPCEPSGAQSQDVRHAADTGGQPYRTRSPARDDIATQRSQSHPSSSRGVIVGSAATAQLAAQREAATRGFRVADSPKPLAASVETTAEHLAAWIGEALTDAGSAQALVLAGETALRLPSGLAPTVRGGRNQHLALALAVALEGVGGWAAAIAGTDGVDGTGPAAGALVDGATAARIRECGGDPQASLAGFDSGTALAAAGDCLLTGPTGTNTGDLIAVVVAGASSTLLSQSARSATVPGRPA